MNAYLSAIILGTLILGSASAPASTALAVPGVWEPYGLNGYDVYALTQHDAYLYAAVYESPLNPVIMGRGVWRRHEHPDSSWVQLGLDGIPISSVWVRPDDPAIIYVSVLDAILNPEGHLLYRTTNGGATWSALEPGPQAFSSRSIVGTPSNPTEMLMSADNFVHRSVDAGETWTGSSNSAGVLVYDLSETNTVWTTVNTAFEDGIIFRSSDDGQQWEVKFSAMVHIGNVAIVPTGRVYAAWDGTILSSDDDGNTWNFHPVGVAGQLFGVDVSPASSNLVLTAEFPGTVSGLWLSGDAGSTWTNVGATMADSLTFRDVVASGTEPGVFYVAAMGWDHANTHAAVWRYQAEDVVATPEPAPPGSERVQLTLRKNPVSQHAMFALSVPEKDVRSSLRVFDARGRVVTELDSWQPVPGGVELIWDGKTSDGSPMTPGVYFGVVETERGKGTTRFVWLD